MTHHRVMLLIRVLLLLLLLRLCIRQTLLIAEQLPLEAVILRLQRHDLASHLLIMDATYVVVLVISRLKEQVTFVPFQPNPQLALIREIWTMILLHFIHVYVCLHDNTLVDRLLHVVAAERFAGQPNRRDVWSLAPQQICRPTDIPMQTKSISKI